jgi:hypothetical protein
VEVSAGESFSSDMPVTQREDNWQQSDGRGSPCRHTLRMTSIATQALPSATSTTIDVDSLDTKLPMNDTDEVLSETERVWADDAFERSDPIAFRRTCALARSRT